MVDPKQSFLELVDALGANPDTGCAHCKERPFMHEVYFVPDEPDRALDGHRMYRLCDECLETRDDEDKSWTRLEEASFAPKLRAMVAWARSP